MAVFDAAPVQGPLLELFHPCLVGMFVNALIVCGYEAGGFAQEWHLTLRAAVARLGRSHRIDRRIRVRRADRLARAGRRALRDRTSVGSSTVSIPHWPFSSLIGLCCVLTAISFVRQIRRPPVNVPQPMNKATVGLTPSRRGATARCQGTRSSAPSFSTAPPLKGVRNAYRTAINERLGQSLQNLSIAARGRFWKVDKFSHRKTTFFDNLNDANERQPTSAARRESQAGAGGLRLSARFAC